MMQIVPLIAAPSQQLEIPLGGQRCVLRVYQKAPGMFMDVLVNDVLLIGGVICQNANRIVRSKYFNFIGDFIFWDSEGTRDPYYTGLDGRFTLYYLEAADLA